MATDEEKCKLAKLLQEIDVPEIRLPERCNELMQEFHKKYEGDENNEVLEEENYENPYVPDKKLLEENEKKLKELLQESKRAKKGINVNLTAVDPKRPWRTHSNKEKLLRIDNEIKHHIAGASLAITPMEEEQMKDLVKECHEETLISRPVGADRLRETVDEARRNLPNFQYKLIENSTATTILPEAHKSTIRSGQYISRPDSRLCFLRSLGELRNLRVLALEYAHIADGNGNALLALLPVIRRPHFHLQLICREDQIPGRADAALGVGGHDIPDTVWRRVNIACPNLYLFMAFFRIRHYNDVRRFLTPSIPLRETHLEMGIDLNVTQRENSDLSCFIRHLGYRYADTLVTLSIHQWRYEVLRLRRLLELMPHLSRLLYTGRVEAKDLRNALIIIACGACHKLKQFNIQIQDEEKKRLYWQKMSDNLMEEFKDIMELFDINFCLQIFKT